MLRFFAGSLKDQWSILHRGVSKHLFERVDSDLTIAEVLMTVLEGSQDIHGVICMDELDPFDAYDFDQEIQGGFHAAFTFDVMTCSEDMAGVETDTDLGMMFERIEIRLEILESLDERLSLSSCWLEEEPWIIFFERFQDRHHPFTDLTPCRFNK